MKIILLGTANPYRGGLATFNERLAKEFENHGHDIVIYNFSLQYPDFLFPGTSQYNETTRESNLNILRKVNSINPINWLITGIELMKLKPDMIIFRYWISFMAPCYSAIAWIAKRNNYTKIFTIVDNATSHEPKFYEKFVTKIFFSITDRFLTMSEKVREDMKSLTSKVPIFSQHPLYDSYSPILSKFDARQRLGLSTEEKIILFFGFIRDYKGLDLLIEAMNDVRMRDKKIKLVIAGEFYSNRDKYISLANNLDLNQYIDWHTDFIPDEKIAEYFCAADAVILPYKSATQSGVTQIAFFYGTPMIASDVGGIKEMVEDGIHGLLIKPNAMSIASGILKFYDENLENDFKKNIERDKTKFSWEALVNRIIE